MSDSLIIAVMICTAVIVLFVLVAFFGTTGQATSSAFDNWIEYRTTIKKLELEVKKARSRARTAVPTADWHPALGAPHMKLRIAVDSPTIDRYGMRAYPHCPLREMLRDLRVALEVSLGEAALAYGCSISEVSQLEYGPLRLADGEAFVEATRLLVCDETRSIRPRAVVTPMRRAR